MDDYHQSTFRQVREAGRSLNLLEKTEIDAILEAIAKETESKMYYILAENQKDLQRMDTSNPKYDRLLLDEERIMDIVKDIRKVATLPSPTGKTLIQKTLDNGLQLSKVTVPFGVIGIIYEARPNVSFDVFSLCLKSGNACILKGGSDARFSNEAIIDLIRNVLDENGVNPNVCTLLANDRAATEELLNARDYVDLIIPRGGQELINYVRENSRIPVIETGAGVCHTYFHKDGELDKGRRIITNAKTRKVSVCNSLDCLVIDKDRLDDLHFLCEELEKKDVVIYADKQAYEALFPYYSYDLLKKADETSFGTEFLDYKMSIKTVGNIEEAISHISQYSSKHSEAIISEDREAISIFEKMVDAACVYANASTAFTDGAQFGMGAEIGISTQKMHARGPMALEELCTYKWIIEGNGQTRS
ncbi:glutamate-5-semialdehyde dehydrogenase [Dysgonomonas sp. PFB1-18]|uniref:glutamate-5-semialdehyde dehydrogenase n=1 Tax=unclassified Dysgonomonas TaxID=2630389 RepID=UPI00247545E3|nr:MULTISPECIES: glutamate-5-semialdehyde dehydrogenase [unclassified Dysgonomonas]MDH6307585.1 glutamate-5-semialdehyde dehydrogenase [Dysgonomonas sp. PF1-14]MDH6337503.1 glutamate-5-semialdehyde dehydrogenase [Dysgonomonas sp. PF1-16]MDH6378728.1 glutamate-5-semialdehyde dehydrogenase [Dysgonomonas sp. PFB1-18]MDH6399146.1 glutamate-5-semialdehyde dehydrogenase [Dysgonomonas sp. PF1-23]